MKYLIALLLVVVAACAAPAATDPQTGSQDPSQMPDNADESMIDDIGTEPGSQGSPDVTFQLTGENFAFSEGETSNPELVVQEGDLVRIEFESAEGMHDWVIDEFDARTSVVTTTDGVTSVEFVADQTGTFEYYCSIGSHRANGMYGNLVVE